MAGKTNFFSISCTSDLVGQMSFRNTGFPSLSQPEGAGRRGGEERGVERWRGEGKERRGCKGEEREVERRGEMERRLRGGEGRGGEDRGSGEERGWRGGEGRGEERWSVTMHTERILLKVDTDCTSYSISDAK